MPESARPCQRPSRIALTSPRNRRNPTTEAPRRRIAKETRASSSCRFLLGTLFGQGTRVGRTRQHVPVPCHSLVAPVQESFREPSQDPEKLPRPVKVPDDKEHCRRPLQRRLCFRLPARYDQQCSRSARAQGVAPADRLAFVALERSVAEDASTVAWGNETHRSAAEPAVAVEQDQVPGVSVLFSHWTNAFAGSASSSTEVYQYRFQLSLGRPANSMRFNG